MKKLIVFILLQTSFMGFNGCKYSDNPATWSSIKVDKWFEKHEWLNGWTVSPDPSINKKEFAVSYFNNKERWDKAFIFLKNNDPSELEIKRTDIDGDIIYATISEYITKNEEDGRFEAHRKYIDIQHVISGAELISIAPISMIREVLVPYDAVKDVEFMTVTKADSYEATPDKFFIFFPSEIHRPGIKTGENKKVRKVVVKLKID